MKNYVAAFIFSILSLLSYGGDFTYLRSWEGLPDGEINAIVQDSSGNMWMATWSGLIKFDGYRYVIYRAELGNKGSLHDKKVKDLLVDSRNNLWVVTSRYLFLFDSNYNTFTEVVFDNEMSGSINILQIVEIGNSIWINTTAGLFTYQLNDLRSGNIRFKKSKVTENGTALNEYYYRLSTYNNILILCRQYPGEPTKLIYGKPYFNNGNTEIEVLSKDFMSAKINSVVFIPKLDRLFYGTSDGLYSVRGSNVNSEKEVQFENQEIQKLFYASNKYLYVATTGPELKYIDLHTGNIGGYRANPDKEGTLLNNNILSVCEDFSNNLWIGHQGQGISILNLKRKAFKTFRRDPSGIFSLNSNTIMCFEKSARELFVGCRTGGLNIIDINELSNERPMFRKIDWDENIGLANVDNQIWDIKRQTDSLLWFCTDRGLSKLKKVKSVWQIEPFLSTPNISEPIRKIEIDENGNLWCGGFSNGLIFIPDPRKNKSGINYRFVSQPDDTTTISDNNIISFIIDSKRRMWVGTQNGINLLESNYKDLDLSGNEKPVLRFRRFVAKTNNSNYLNNNEINDIFEHPDGRIWVMTQGGGINIYDAEQNQWEHLTTKSGLPSNDVLGCLSDETGNFWLSTSRGLVKLNEVGDNYDIAQFDLKDGIQGDIFMVNSFYKATDGQMFFGGDNGFTCFYPNEIKSNKALPRVVLTNLEIEEILYEAGDTIGKNFVLEKVLDKTDDIILPFRYNSFKIGVSAIHFQDPSKNKISYYLERYNTSWQTIPARNQQIEFVKLPFGKYKLHIKAISSDNLESEIKTINIEIRPPWYLRWYSVSLFLLIAICMIFGFVFLMVHRQKLIYQRKLADVSARNNENKMQFLTNIAHDLRTPLSLIIAPVMDLKRNFTGNNQILDSHLNIISRNSNYLLRLINQIIDFQKSDAGKLTLVPEMTNFTGLIKDIVLNFNGLESRTNVHILVNTPEEPVFVETDIQKVEEILYNLLSNAFKHTPAGETIEVSLELITENGLSDRNAKIRLSVFNHGPEIAEEHLTLIFERFYKINEQVEGSGIGLSYTKSLVELLRGKIKAESVDGKGVVFVVELPVEYRDIKLSKPVFEENKIEKQFFTTKSNTVELQGSSKRKVLIVEDNQELLDYLKNLLSRNYECLTALNGAEGLEIIIKEKPSVIITDLVMPVMDGMALIKEIKGNIEICHIPIILLTANNSDEARKTGYGLGADSYISKPFDNELLLAQADRLIKNRELIRDKYKSQNFMVEVESNSSKDNDFVQTVKNLFEEHLTNPEFNVNQLSQLLNISTTQLYRRLKQLTGHTPVEFIRLIRLQKAHALLSGGKNTVKEVCYLTGFNNLSYFIKCFKEQFGVTPANFRDSGQHNDSD